MSTFQTIIVDDERLVRNDLRRMLEPHEAIEVVAEAADVVEAEAAIRKHAPDLLLLDVQMPGESGFDLLERLDAVPHVIFVTAYDEYALRAFEVNALDYLVKPVEEQRLASALETVEERAATPGPTPGPARSTEPGAEDPGEPKRLGATDRVFVKDGRRCWFVRLAEVRLFEAAGNYVRLYFDDEQPLIYRSLSALEKRLDPNRFFRASRQHILNLSWVEDVNSRPDGKLIAHLPGDTNIELSRRRSRTFREELSL
jgi:two-component system LytT family response regulator